MQKNIAGITKAHYLANLRSSNLLFIGERVAYQTKGKVMDYVEALMAVAESLSDIRRRLIALEASVASLDGDTPSVEALVERIEDLENKDWNDGWEDNVVSIVETAIDNIDWEDKVMAEVRGMSISLSID